MRFVKLALVCFSILLFFNSVSSQSEIKFSFDLQKFYDLDQLSESLEGVEIIGLGENTHGLGEVFSTKVEIIKFLHQNLDFDLLLFEGGYGDAAMAWNTIEKQSPDQLATNATSYKYYRSKEMSPLYEYIIEESSSKKPLMIGGIDCQVQQDFFKKRIKQIIATVDPEFATLCVKELNNFNRLYLYEREQDAANFALQMDTFEHFIHNFQDFMLKHNNQLESTFGKEVIEAMVRMINIFQSTYTGMEIGDLSYPIGLTIRDQAMFENVKWYKERYPKKKIIIWAQNSHLENQSYGEDQVKWMGHLLKTYYDSKYYSVGAFVYKGTDLIHYNGKEQEFLHDSEDYVAYHCERLKMQRLILDLRSTGIKKYNWVSKFELKGMEVGGYDKRFILDQRFDGLLFVKESGPPTF